MALKLIYMYIYGFLIFFFFSLCGSDRKEFTCKTEDVGSISGLGRFPEGRHGDPLQYSCLENPHGKRSLMGSSP